MIKKQVDIILEHQLKRRKKKIKLISISILLIIIGMSLILTFRYLSQNYYLNYTEQANIDYKVYLKNNDFYNVDYLGPNNNVIASLIQKITPNFSYDLGLDHEIEYKYNYTLTADVVVKEKSSSKPLFNTEKELKRVEDVSGKGTRVQISEDLELNYDEYNDLIKKFIMTYGLDTTESTLTIGMNVQVFDKLDGTQINKSQRVLSLEIPLTTNTIEIGMSSNIISGEGTALISKSDVNIYTYMILVSGIIITLVGVLYLYKFVNYVIESRSAETMYEKKLRNILNNYRTYIQKINNEISVDETKVMQTDSFNEMLEIRDTLQKPILMVQEGTYKTKFYILSEGIVFMYSISAQEIRNRLIEQSKQQQNNNKGKH